MSSFKIVMYTVLIFAIKELMFLQQTLRFNIKQIFSNFQEHFWRSVRRINLAKKPLCDISSRLSCSFLRAFWERGITFFWSFCLCRCWFFTYRLMFIWCSKCIFTVFAVVSYLSVNAHQNLALYPGVSGFNLAQGCHFGPF
jgi:hypothetical protein